MRRTSLIVVLAAAGMWTTMLPAEVWLGHRHLGGFYDGYGYGYGVIYDLSSAWNAGRYIAQSERLMGQQIAAQQAAARQSDIRNEMSAAAWMRSEQISAQQQSDRDWWFQVQQQQMAASRQAAQFAAMTSGIEPAPKAATDVIKWPRLLQASQFADQRTQIEAPYRRNSKRLSTPMAKDYQNMIEAAQQMKLILKGMTANISAQDYLDTQVFLDKLAAEARTRIEKTSPKK
jgi:hypothetical protein